jgi:hypothetical protein
VIRGALHVALRGERDRQHLVGAPLYRAIKEFQRGVGSRRLEGHRGRKGSQRQLARTELGRIRSLHALDIRSANARLDDCGDVRGNPFLEGEDIPVVPIMVDCP